MGSSKTFRRKPKQKTTGCVEDAIVREINSRGVVVTNVVQPDGTTRLRIAPLAAGIERTNMNGIALWKVNLEEASSSGGSHAEFFALTPSEAHPPAQIAERFEKLHSPDCTVYRIDRITCLGVLPTAWIERHDFTRQIRELIDDAKRSD